MFSTSPSETATYALPEQKLGQIQPADVAAELEGDIRLRQRAPVSASAKRLGPRAAPSRRRGAICLRLSHKALFPASHAAARCS